MFNSHIQRGKSMTNSTVDLYLESDLGILVMENTSITKTNVQEIVQTEVSKQIVKVKLPLILSSDGARTIDVVLTPDMTVSNALQQMSESIKESDAELDRKLFDQRGNLNANMNVYVNGKNIKHEGKGGTVALGSGMATVLKADDQIDLLPAVAGG